MQRKTTSSQYNQPGEGNLPTKLQNYEIRFPLYTKGKEPGYHKQDPPEVLFQDRPQRCNLRSHRDKFRLTQISVRFQRQLEIAKGGNQSSLFRLLPYQLPDVVLHIVTKGNRQPLLVEWQEGILGLLQVMTSLCSLLGDLPADEIGKLILRWFPVK